MLDYEWNDNIIPFQTANLTLICYILLLSQLNYVNRLIFVIVI